MLSMLKRPSAWLPIAMSLASLTMLLVLLAVYRGAGLHDPDEGPAAHIFQLLQTLQVPVGIFFAAKWLPRTPKPALVVLGLQVLAWILPAALVLYLGL